MSVSLRAMHSPPRPYTDSFGWQWNRHARTQLDSHTGASLSRDRLFQTTAWPTDLTGEVVLEAGCGAGRFTEVLAGCGARVYTFDLSAAVAACRANNPDPNVVVMQADIYHIPLPVESFDRVLCLGVLQHTPDPRMALLNLARYLKPGGRIAIDIYDLASHRFPRPKYWLRPITRRLPPRLLYRLIVASAAPLLGLKQWLRRWRLGRPLAGLVPIYDYAGRVSLNPALLEEMAVLDTFDGLAARYEKPQEPATVAAWFAEAGLEDVFVGPGPNGIIARGVRPASPAPYGSH